MVYLDYAASTPIDEDVAASLHVAQGQIFGNSMSLHTPGLTAARLVSDAKEQMARLLRVKQEELIVTSGATEANNLALFGAARAYSTRGNHIITTRLEHASVTGPLTALEQEGFDVTYLPVDVQGCVKKADVLAAIRPETILVSMIHVNNELGSIQQVSAIAAAIKAQHPQVIVHSDMAQSIGKTVVDLTYVDLATFSGHKFYAPKSIGLLYKSDKISLTPLFYGGPQQGGMRPGTENPTLVAAMAKAMRLSFEREADQQIQHALVAKRNYLVYHILKAEPNVRMSIDHDDFTKVTPYIVHFQVLHSATEIQTYLNAFVDKGIYLSTRSSCHARALQHGNPLLEALGYSVAESRRGLRISLSHLTTMEELEIFGRAFKQIIRKLAV